MPEEHLGEGAPVVVIVDDDEAIRSALARLVRTLGYGSQTFATGEELLAEIGSLRPGCVLTDIQMPGMNGFALLRHLQQLNAELPVLIMTAYPSRNNCEQAFAGGARVYMAKPLDDVQLEAWLRKVMGEPHSG